MSRPRHLSVPNTAEGIRAINEMQRAYDRDPAGYEAEQQRQREQYEMEQQAMRQEYERQQEERAIEDQMYEEQLNSQDDFEDELPF